MCRCLSWQTAAEFWVVLFNKSSFIPFDLDTFVYCFYSFFYVVYLRLLTSSTGFLDQSQFEHGLLKTTRNRKRNMPSKLKVMPLIEKSNGIHENSKTIIVQCCNFLDKTRQDTTKRSSKIIQTYRLLWPRPTIPGLPWNKKGNNNKRTLSMGQVEKKSRPFFLKIKSELTSLRLSL